MGKKRIRLPRIAIAQASTTTCFRTPICRIPLFSTKEEEEEEEPLLDKSLVRRSVAFLEDKVAAYRALVAVPLDGGYKDGYFLLLGDSSTVAMDELTRNRRHLARMESMLRNRTVAEKTRRRILSSRSLNGGSQRSIQEDEDNEEEDPRLTNQDQTTNTNGNTNTTNTTESEIHKNDSNVSNLSDSSRSARISETNACNGTTSATGASTAKGTNDVVQAQTKKKMKNPPEHVKAKFCAWAASFASLDPRIRIHRFFQEVAQEGDQKLAKDSRNQQPEKPTNEKSARELLASCFNMAQVFSVWRPCSKEAIRKMMAGHGVGKGLDIKGKSAKFGKCSAYVPFLQIHSERDKHKIEWLPQDARMTIFYANLETRNQALKVATRVRDEMVATVQSLDDSMLSQRDSITEAVRQAGMDNSSNSRLSLNTNTNSEHQKSSLLQRRTSDDTPALKKKSEHSLLHRATSDGTAASIQQRRRSSDLERSSLQRGTSDGTAILSIRRRSSNMDDSATSTTLARQFL